MSVLAESVVTLAFLKIVTWGFMVSSRGLPEKVLLAEFLGRLVNRVVFLFWMLPVASSLGLIPTLFSELAGSLLFLRVNFGLLASMVRILFFLTHRLRSLEIHLVRQIPFRPKHHLLLLQLLMIILTSRHVSTGPRLTPTITVRLPPPSKATRLLTLLH